MKWWFRLNKSRLYRRFNFDPHYFILRSCKLDRVFKNNIIQRKYLKKLKHKKNRIKFLHKIRKRYWGRLKNFNKIDLRQKLFFSHGVNLKKKWYSNFWKKVKFNYNLKISRYKLKSKKKFSRRLYRLRKLFKKIVWLKVRKFRYKTIIQKRKTKKIDPFHARVKAHRRKRYSKRIWLGVNKYRKKQKTWWLLRINLRKTAIHYGFKKLKKFGMMYRKANVSMAINSYQNDKLESMLNLFLIKINMFDNIFLANNFIKYSNITLLDGCHIFDPYHYVSVKQIVSFSKVTWMQNIFKKKALFNKYNYVKNYNTKKNKKLTKLVRILTNVPFYIHYDYQIMCFSSYRLPNKQEHAKELVTVKDSWCIDTQLHYN